jgi:hypothetical protein
MLIIRNILQLSAFVRKVVWYDWTRVQPPSWRVQLRPQTAPKKAPKDSKAMHYKVLGLTNTRTDYR